MICLYCSAENDSVNEKCYSCGAPVPKLSILANADFEKLKEFVNVTEKQLDATGKKEDNKALIVMGLVMLSLTYLSYFLYKHLEHKILLIILVIIIFLVSFYLIGSIYFAIYNKAIEKAFNNTYKDKILEFLKENHFRKADFSYVVASELKENSLLLRNISNF